MKFGLRVIKTGLAIGLSMFVTNAVGNDAYIYAGLIAMFAVQPSIYRSYVTMFDQFKGNIVGALTATGIVLLFGNSFFMVSIAAMITISLCVKFNVLDKVPSLVTVVAIMESNTGDYSTIEFALVRFTAVTIGFFTAFFVNVLLFPPKHEKRLLTSIIELNEKIRRLTLESCSEDPSRNCQRLQQDIHQLEKPLKNLYSTYDFFHEEMHFPKSKTRAHYRKIVFIKQLTVTTRLNYQLLKKLQKNENDRHHLPAELKAMIESHIEKLQGYHEELLCKIQAHNIKDITSSDSAALTEAYAHILQAYSQMLAKQDAELQNQSAHILPFLSHLMEYREELIHLDQIIHSYYTYHQKSKTARLPKKLRQLLP